MSTQKQIITAMFISLVLCGFILLLFYRGENRDFVMLFYGLCVGFACLLAAYVLRHQEGEQDD